MGHWHNSCYVNNSWDGQT